MHLNVTLRPALPSVLTVILSSHLPLDHAEEDDGLYGDRSLITAYAANAAKLDRVMPVVLLSSRRSESGDHSDAERFESSTIRSGNVVIFALGVKFGNITLLGE